MEGWRTKVDKYLRSKEGLKIGSSAKTYAWIRTIFFFLLHNPPKKRAENYIKSKKNTSMMINPQLLPAPTLTFFNHLKRIFTNIKLELLPFSQVPNMATQVNNRDDATLKEMLKLPLISTSIK